MSSRHWQRQHLGRLVRLTSGQRPSGFKFGSSGAPYFKVEQLGRSVKYLDHASTPYRAENLPIVPAGSVLIAKRGAAIALNRVRLLAEPGFMDTNVMALSPIEGLDSEFLYYWLSYRGLWDIADVTSVPQINNKHINPLEIDLPGVDEQRTISATLRDMDARVASLEHVLTKKRAIKQGVMQELLTARTRLPGFSGEWAVSTIGSIVRIVGGGTPARSVDVYWGGSIPWATIKDISSFNPTSTQEYITPLAVQASATRLVRAGTPILAARMLVGKAVRFQVDVAINQDLKALLPGADVDASYLCHWFDANGPILAASAGGSTVAGTSTAQIKALTIDLPPFDEQRAIATVLDETDAEITVLERRLETVRAIRLGMVQELLTGGTRLVPMESST